VQLSDVVVVGAGILGLAVARELSGRHPELAVTVLEREADVGRHQTGHNSGVIHSGIYYTPGSLKARMCVTGSRLMYEYCAEQGVPVERCGKLIVAIRPEELGRMEELERRGRANGVEGVRRLTSAEIGEVEPNARGVAALHVPGTGITDYGQVTRVMAVELRGRGVAVRTGVRVRAIRPGARPVVVTSEGEIETRMVVSCAGLWSDRLAAASGAPSDPRIVPFRGGYLHVRPTADPVNAPLLRGLVYPVPDPELPFLGVHVTKHVDGEFVLGPTALLAGARDAYRIWKLRPRDVLDTLTWPGTYRMARTFWRTGFTEIAMAASRARFVQAAAEYVPAVAGLGVVGPDIGGVRAQAVGRNGALVDDFVISETPGALHVRNAPSPAATSSLALAQELADRVEASESWAGVGSA
jgi:L-2-hydroxyglutarate oxidase